MKFQCNLPMRSAASHQRSYLKVKTCSAAAEDGWRSIIFAAASFHVGMSLPYCFQNLQSDKISSTAAT